MLFKRLCLAPSIILSLTASFVAAHEDTAESVSYTTDAFKEEVAKKNHFVMFYAPWCEHCKRLGPTWNNLAKKFGVGDDAEVVIAQVDCTVETALCSENDVTGYPTLKFFKAGESDGVKFRGSRDSSTLKSFIFEQLGKKDDDDDDESKVGTRQNKLVDLTQDTFNDHVKSGKHFVKFYAPWCGHCQNLAPTWEELAQSLDESLGVSVGKIDCTLHKGVCNEFEVKGYPTMLWIEDGKKIEKYQGARSLNDLKDYVLRKSSSDNKGQTAAPVVSESSPVLSLTGSSFDSSIDTGVTFVKFYAPWCGHCKRMATTWEDLAQKFKENPSVQIAKVDCTLEENKELCSAQEVNGFPTVFIYRDGEKITEYNGSRSLDDLYQFVLKHSEAKDKDEL